MILQISAMKTMTVKEKKVKFQDHISLYVDLLGLYGM